MTATRMCIGPGCERVSHRLNNLCAAHNLQSSRGKELTPIRRKRKNGVRMKRDDQGRKQCFRCEVWKSDKEFALDRRSPDNMSSWCRRCSHLSQYNMLPQNYDSMLADQGGACATCGKAPDTRPLQVDHDHSCCPQAGRSCGHCIRGLLCFQCNSTLGQVSDSVDTLKSLISYLERSHS